ncbi:protein NRT1/ PTR FAMILY 1.2-like isoform X2 [Malania oleifera]|nr:protein NRT1/ PTR FAMILY 1.2-like isoform X2 [Malania oleifera]
MPNMIMYLMREYGLETARGSNILFYWSAATNLMPVLGAFLADSFVGRFRMIGFGSIVSLLGMFLLWLTTMIPQVRPPPCNHYSSNCDSATLSQLILLCSSLALMSIGAGGIRSSSMVFGADQLVARGNMKNTGNLESFFNWYYAAASLSVVIAMTCIVYLQENMGWKVGFGVPVVLMFLSAVSFFLASHFYVKLKATTSFVTGFFQVMLASYKNRDLSLPSQCMDVMYYHKKGSALLVPSGKLRFLNKACVVRNAEVDLMTDGRASDPWSLCTVDQVEELKALIRVIPLWSTGIMMSVCMSQDSFRTLLTKPMDRHITPDLEIPAGSFSVFMVISLTIWIALYDRMILPLASKIMGKPARLNVKLRMGIGIFISGISMAVSAIVESVRRKTAIREGFSDHPDAEIDMSAMWLLPQLCLGGLAEAFNAVGQNEFYYSELPKSMSSIASTLFGVGMSIGNLAASFIMSTVDDVTKRGGKESWVSSNINKGHYDFYYWLLAALSLVNLMYFLVCSKAYGPCARDESGILNKEDMMSNF